jgi:phosphatidylethanolamine-binding protein (PEBP) family uncharacterized protein
MLRTPKLMKKLLIFFIVASILNSFSTSASAVTAKSVSFQAEVWADNWFELYVNGKKVGTDSVPITTERSFNSEKIKFTATYPLTIGVIAKDYTENASGLEYIGKSNQQIGDAGFILQIRETASGKIVGYTTNKWRSFVVNTAPTNPSCVSSKTPLTDCLHKDYTIPKSWNTYSFKDSSWKYATSFSKEEVGVKEGYFDITWTPSASLIWSSDLKLDNVVLFRMIVKSSTSAGISESTSSSNKFSISVPSAINVNQLPISATCDGAGISPAITWSNAPSGTKYLTIIMDSIPGPPRPGETSTENHFYLTNYNIPSSVHSISEGNKVIGALGQNFLGRALGYTPPCSQGPGAKIYTITIYALSEKIDLLPALATESTLLSAMDGKILEKTKIDLTYSRAA